MTDQSNRLDGIAFAKARQSRSDLTDRPLERTDWFTGLSQEFLNCRTAKLLLLAGTDRLDKDLLIGQMQGSFLFLFSSGLFILLS